MFGSDWLANAFLSIFLFGLIFTTASLLLGFSHVGGLHGHDLGGHAGHAGHVGHTGGTGHTGHAAGSHGHDHIDIRHGAHVDMDTGHEGPGLLNMPTMMAFITWFGGAGYIFRQALGVGAILAVPMALLSGIVGAGVMFALLARVLWPMMSKPLSRADYTLPGTPARVVSPIREGGVGEIVYTKGGTRFTAGARSADSLPIPKGAEVVILSYQRGMAYVQDVEAALNTVERGEKARMEA